jgi:periplasmic copper chaperone A
MHDRINRRLLLRSGIALGGTLLLPTTQACEVQAEFLRITHPWTRGTASGAESAVLCMRIDNVTADDRLIGVQTPVAGGALLAGMPDGQPLDLPIPEGSELDMHEQGLHLRLAPLRLTLHAGRSYELQLTFARSGVVMTTLSVDFPRFA